MFDSENLPGKHFDAIFMNGAFCCIHPSLWKSEINRLLLSLKDEGYLFLTDVPVLKKHILCVRSNKDFSTIQKVLDIFTSKLNGVLYYGAGVFFVDEKIIKKWYPQTIIEDEWNKERSFFIIKKSSDL